MSDQIANRIENEITLVLEKGRSYGYTELREELMKRKRGCRSFRTFDKRLKALVARGTVERKDTGYRVEYRLKPDPHDNDIDTLERWANAEFLHDTRVYLELLERDLPKLTFLDAAKRFALFISRIRLLQTANQMDIERGRSRQSNIDYDEQLARQLEEVFALLKQTNKKYRGPHPDWIIQLTSAYVHEEGDKRLQVLKRYRWSGKPRPQYTLKKGRR